MSRPKKLVLIGLDAMIPEFVQKFSREGIIPNMTNLIENGVFSEMLSMVQVETPTNWTCIGTGALPGTHGINSFGFHIEGEPFENVYDMGNNLFPIVANVNTVHFMNRLCKAEYVWQAAEKVGKKSILVNFPGGWPPNISNGIVVDGTGPFSSPLSKMTGWGRYSSSPHDPNELKVEIVPAENWVNLPPSKLSPLEGVIDITGKEEFIYSSKGWLTKENNESINNYQKTAPIYYLLIYSSNSERYDTLAITKERDFNTKVTILNLNEESKWLHEQFEPTIGEKIYANMLVRKEFKTKVNGKFRLKLCYLSQDGKSIQIDRTPIYNLENWAYPQNIADELIDNLELEKSSFDKEKTRSGGITSKKSPLCQVYETVEDMAEGLIKTCKYLAKNYQWDLFFTQIHSPDGINHDELNGLCKDSPTYDPKEEGRCWDKFREVYRILDRYVGEVVSACVDEETTVIVVSDHGGIPTKKRVLLEHFLLKDGLIAYKKNENGRLVIDTKKSKVISGINYVTQNIWINMKGRDPDGVVNPSDYEKIRDRVIEVLYSIKDPETGEHPIVLALRKEDAENFGNWGERLGDIVYLYKEGYTNKFANGITGIDPSDMPENGFEPVLEGPEFGRHHSYLPATRYCGCSVRATFIMSGPGVRKGYVRRTPIRTIDVAPTIAFLMGIPYPETMDGLVFGDGLIG